MHLPTNKQTIKTVKNYDIEGMTRENLFAAIYVDQKRPDRYRKKRGKKHLPLTLLETVYKTTGIRVRDRRPRK